MHAVAHTPSHLRQKWVGKKQQLLSLRSTKAAESQLGLSETVDLKFLPTALICTQIGN